MIRDIEISLMDAQKISARLLKHGETFRRVIIEIDSLTIRLDPEDAQRLRDALDGVLSEQPLQAGE